MPIFLYWFRCTIRFWNNLLSSNNPLLEKVVRADLLLANRSDTWTYQVLDALWDVPDSQHLLDAARSRQPVNVKQFELTLREHIIRTWRPWQFYSIWGSSFQQNYENISHSFFFYFFSFSFVICRVTDILFQLSCPRRQVQLCNLNLNSAQQYRWASVPWFKVAWANTHLQPTASAIR